MPKPGPARVKPGILAQISGNFGNLEPGHPEIWDPTEILQIEHLKIQIHSAQKVGKFLAPFGTISDIFFFMDRTNAKKQNLLSRFDIHAQLY